MIALMKWWTLWWKCLFSWFRRYLLVNRFRGFNFLETHNCEICDFSTKIFLKKEIVPHKHLPFDYVIKFLTCAHYYMIIYLFSNLCFRNVLILEIRALSYLLAMGVCLYCLIIFHVATYWYFTFSISHHISNFILLKNNILFMYILIAETWRTNIFLTNRI